MTDNARPGRSLPLVVVPSLLRHAAAALWHASPYMAAMALALGGAVFVGANLSNAMPSDRHPWGFPGPSSFSNGVAMNRPAYVLAASVPALLLGLAALRERRPQTTTVWSLLGLASVHLFALWLGAWLAALIGSEGAGRTSREAFWAFTVAHALLASVFYGVAFAAASVSRAFAPAAAASLWLGYVALFDHWTRWRLLRQVGYPGLTAGLLPTWFFVAQALSPLTTYRALLITWHPGFRDYEEKALLASVALPAWMAPEVLSLALALWIVVLLDVAVAAWWLRGRGSRHPGPAASGP